MHPSSCLYTLMHFFVEEHLVAATFTVEDAINECGFGWFQVKATLFAGLVLVCVLLVENLQITIHFVFSDGCLSDHFLARYCLAGGAMRVQFVGVARVFYYNSQLIVQIRPSEIVSVCKVAFCGMICGSPIWGSLSDKYGRKKVRIASLDLSVLYYVLL